LLKRRIRADPLWLLAGGFFVANVVADVEMLLPEAPITRQRLNQFYVAS